MSVYQTLVDEDKETRNKRVGDLNTQLENLRAALEQRGCTREYIDSIQRNGNPFYTSLNRR